MFAGIARCCFNAASPSTSYCNRIYWLFRSIASAEQSATLIALNEVSHIVSLRFIQAQRFGFVQELLDTSNANHVSVQSGRHVRVKQELGVQVNGCGQFFVGLKIVFLVVAGKS